MSWHSVDYIPDIYRICRREVDFVPMLSWVRLLHIEGRRDRHGWSSAITSAASGHKFFISTRIRHCHFELNKGNHFLFSAYVLIFRLMVR